MSAIGTVVSTTIDTNTSIEKNSNTKVGEITLTKGVWIVAAHVEWSTSFNEYAQFNVTEGGSIRGGTGNNGGGQSSAFIHTVTGSPVNIGIFAYHSSSTARKVRSSTYLHAAKLASID